MAKVLYQGTSHRRLISKEDFKAVGIDHETLEWSAKNLFMVDRDQITLSEEEFKRVIGDDKDFKVVEEPSKDLPRSHPYNHRTNPDRATIPADAGSDQESDASLDTTGAPTDGGGSTPGDTGSAGGRRGRGSTANT